MAKLFLAFGFFTLSGERMLKHGLWIYSDYTGMASEQEAVEKPVHVLCKQYTHKNYHYWLLNARVKAPSGKTTIDVSGFNTPVPFSPVPKPSQNVSKQYIFVLSAMILKVKSDGFLGLDEKAVSSFCGMQNYKLLQNDQ